MKRESNSVAVFVGTSVLKPGSGHNFEGTLQGLYELLQKRMEKRGELVADPKNKHAFKNECKDVSAGAPYFTFGPLHGERRSAKNISQITLAVLDLDDDAPKVSQIVRTAKLENLELFAYETGRSMVDGTRKVRVVVPLAAPKEAKGKMLEEYARTACLQLMDTLGLLEDCEPDPASWTVSQPMYGPLMTSRCPEGPAMAYTGPGYRPLRINMDRTFLTKSERTKADRALGKTASGAIPADALLAALERSKLYVGPHDTFGWHCITCPDDDHHGLSRKDGASNSQTVYMQAHTGGHAFPSVACFDTECPQHGKPKEGAARLREYLIEEGVLPSANDHGLTLTSFADVRDTAIDWLWEPVIAYGKMTLLAGQPGMGKSTLTLAVAVRIVNGEPLPFSKVVPPPDAKVLILAAEDSADDTTGPRLQAAGLPEGCEQRSRILKLAPTVFEDDKERTINLAMDLPRIRLMLEQHPEIRVIIIDPVTGYLGGSDQNATSDIRAALQPLCTLAEEKGLAVVLISHMNKSSSTEAMNRVLGSVQFQAVVRSSWLMVPLEEDGLRGLLPVKVNIGRDDYGFGYRLEPVKVALRHPRTGEATEEEVARCEFSPQRVHRKASDALSAQAKRENSDPEDMAKAIGILKDAQDSGHDRTVDVDQQMAHAGVRPATVKIALEKLGLLRQRVGGIGAAGKWCYRPPKPLADKDSITYLLG